MRYLFYLIVSIFFLLLLTPFSNLFFYIQHNFLKQEKIFIVSRNIEDNVFGFDINKALVIYDGMDTAAFDRLKVFITIFFNEINVKNLKINSQDIYIKVFRIIHNIFSPFIVTIEGFSNIGEFKGKINLKDGYGRIYILNLKDESFKSFLKHDKKGYFYEIKF